MTQTVKRKLRRAAIAWGILMLLGLTVGLLIWKGVIWFNMPSRRTYPVRGVDVSHYQGDIDFETIAAQDISFAFIKATEGSGTTDECFAENWANARSAGLYTGAYHFFSFDSGGDTQADNFIAAVPVETDALPPVIDLEHYRSDDLPDAETVRENLKEMLSRLKEAYGKTPIIYTTNTCYAAYLADSDLEYILWIRSILTPPASSLDWQFWQYHPRGILEGYTGGTEFIDLNVFRGTQSELAALAQ